MERRHERLFVLAFQRLFCRHPLVAKALLEARGTPEAVFEGDRAALRDWFGACHELWKRFARFDDWQEIERDAKAIEALGAEAIALSDPRYPALLREIDDPPPALIIRGETAGAFARPSIAIVGARRASPHGRELAASIAEGLAAQGYAVVSGMAYGIDAAAHRGALHGGGATIAVTGCGPEIDYPPCHRDLAREIERTGAILTEFPVGEQPLPQNFPQRNRVISGLALGVVVIEAAEKSGSLITARFALEQGREVMAVPGQGGTVQARGANRLLRDGAALIECAEDVVNVVEPLVRVRGFPESAGQFKIDVAKDSPLLRALPSRGGLSVDELVMATRKSASEVLEELARLALAEIVEELPGRRWRRRNI